MRNKRYLGFIPGGLLLLVAAAPVGEAVAPVVPTVTKAEGVAAFLDVMIVLQHPRCQNCHPAGDAPLQGDAGTPHRMAINRFSAEVGLSCSACHREEGLDLINGPPASPAWGLPAANQVFVGRTAAELCAQLKDPKTTGGRDLAALLEHVSHDELVLQGWASGGGRAPPPLTHPAFVGRFESWVQAGAPCPD